VFASQFILIWRAPVTRSSFRRSIAFVAVLSALAVAVPAGAQTVKKDAYGDTYYEEELVITAPYVRRDRSGVGINRTEEVTVSRVVSARDLDLRYDRDVAILRERIRDTAAIVCDEAQDELRGPPSESDRQCEREAVREAMADANDLISYRRG
jgi:UrcA family protein